MKKFLIAVFLGYGLIFLFLIVSTQHRTGNTDGAKDGSGSGNDFYGGGGNARESASIRGVDGKISSQYYFKRPSDDPAFKQSDPSSKSALRTFYAGGALSSEWSVGKNSALKEFRTYYEDGKVWMELSMERDLMEGTIKFYYPGGALWGSAEYRNGILEGQAKLFYENGSPWAEMQFDAGILKELPKVYSEGESTNKEARPTVSEKDKVPGYFRAYDEKGELKVQWDYSGEESGNRLTTKYATGEISSSWELKDGKLYGPARFYFRKGTLWAELAFKDGVRDGILKTYYEGGMLWTKAKFVAGRLVGALEVNYPKGVKWILLDDNPVKGRSRLMAFSEKEVAAT